MKMMLGMSAVLLVGVCAVSRAQEFNPASLSDPQRFVESARAVATEASGKRVILIQANTQPAKSDLWRYVFYAPDSSRTKNLFIVKAGVAGASLERVLDVALGEMPTLELDKLAVPLSAAYAAAKQKAVDFARERPGPRLSPMPDSIGIRLLQRNDGEISPYYTIGFPAVGSSGHHLDVEVNAITGIVTDARGSIIN